MQLELKKYLSDILTSIEHIVDFTKDVNSLGKYSSNILLKRGVERELEIIGEALSKALLLEPTLSITNSRKIINTRNKIIHGYDQVDDAIIWAVILKHLPILKIEIEKMIMQ